MYTLRTEYGTAESTYAKFYIIKEKSVEEGILYEGFGGERFEPGYTYEEIQSVTVPIGREYKTIESARKGAAALSAILIKKARREFEQYLEGLEVE